MVRFMCRKNWKFLKKSNGLSGMSMKESWKRKIECYKEQQQVLSKRIEQLESEKKDLAMRKVGCLDSCAISRWSRIQLHLTLALLWSIFR